MTAIAEPEARTIRAPRGNAISCRGWQQEAALRMLMNNLDPDVAERPEDLVVYGGTGRAARSWGAFDAIVATLRDRGVAGRGHQAERRQGGSLMSTQPHSTDVRTKPLARRTSRRTRYLAASSGGAGIGGEGGRAFR